MNQIQQEWVQFGSNIGSNGLSEFKLSQMALNWSKFDPSVSKWVQMDQNGKSERKNRENVYFFVKSKILKLFEFHSSQ